MFYRHCTCHIIAETSLLFYALNFSTFRAGHQLLGQTRPNKVLECSISKDVSLVHSFASMAMANASVELCAFQVFSDVHHCDALTLAHTDPLESNVPPSRPAARVQTLSEPNHPMGHCNCLQCRQHTQVASWSYTFALNNEYQGSHPMITPALHKPPCSLKSTRTR